MGRSKAYSSIHDSKSQLFGWDNVLKKTDDVTIYREPGTKKVVSVVGIPRAELRAMISDGVDVIEENEINCVIKDGRLLPRAWFKKVVL